jgi:hypothetical protein
MIALPITATISPATAMSNAIIGLSSAAAAGHQCVRKTFEQRQFRQAVRIGASTNLLLPNAAANRAKFSIWCSGSIFGLRCLNTGEARLQIAEHVLAVRITARRFVQLPQTSRRRTRHGRCGSPV